ncbi:OprO/OprP family phosphate-selective porin [Paraglaciecola mesophila]|nr:porin [Paraglaciecola mesophila]
MTTQVDAGAQNSERKVSSQPVELQNTGTVDLEDEFEPVTAVSARDHLVSGEKANSQWSVKPRGRALYDYNELSSVPSSITGADEGASSEVRRLRFGLQGTAPRGFGYKVIADFADDVIFTDAFVSFKEGDLKLTLGQHNTFQGLEELSSSNDTSFTERAAYTDAFGFERRVGLSATYTLNDFLLEGGVFSDNIDDLGGKNNSFSVDGRVSYATTFQGTLIHLGSSIHIRDLGDEIDSVRYRQRPHIHSVDTRFINTEDIVGASDETSYGLEAAIIAGRFHVVGETHWLNVTRSDYADPTFFGGSIEAGFFITQDKREYKGGVFKGVKVNQPVSNGGIGAWQVNVRYDRLDLVDAGIIGGTQDAYMASLIWTLVDDVRLILNYGHLSYSHALDIEQGAPDNFSVNVFGIRGQIGF